MIISKKMSAAPYLVIFLLQYAENARTKTLGIGLIPRVLLCLWS